MVKMESSEEILKSLGESGGRLDIKYLKAARTIYDCVLIPRERWTESTLIFIAAKIQQDCIENPEAFAPGL